MVNIKKILILFLLNIITYGACQAQFLDSFNSKKIEGWFFFTGDGDATMDFKQNEGYARMLIDATNDKHNVYWTLIKRDVAASLDLNKLKDPSYELRVEARVRVSNAPRRINFMLNTQRTTNFHEHLMEFDIPDTSSWHTVSYTTKNFDAVPGDSLFVQLCATDWGIGKYYVDIDYYRADIVDINHAGADKGVLVPYHPPVPELVTFSNHIDVSHDALINSDFPDINFNNWQVQEQNGIAQILTVNANQWAILRWDLNSFTNSKVDGSGILEITTYSVPKGGNYSNTFGEDLGMEFGKVRVIEIIGGDSEWNQKTVTYNSFMKELILSDVFNSQMIFDIELSDEPGSKNFITISNPVMQRLIDGKTKGLVILPLGALDASFYSSENEAGDQGPKLHFNIKK